MKLEKTIGDYLRDKGWTLSIAESCTGGLICDRITNISGSSDYFMGGMVTYSNESKAEHLGVPLSIIKEAWSCEFSRWQEEWPKEFEKLFTRLSDCPPQVWQDPQAEQRDLPSEEFSSGSLTEKNLGEKIRFKREPQER